MGLDLCKCMWMWDGRTIRPPDDRPTDHQIPPNTHNQHAAALPLDVHGDVPIRPHRRGLHALHRRRRLLHRLLRPAGTFVLCILLCLSMCWVWGAFHYGLRSLGVGCGVRGDYDPRPRRRPINSDQRSDSILHTYTHAGGHGGSGAQGREGGQDPGDRGRGHQGISGSVSVCVSGCRGDGLDGSDGRVCVRACVCTPTDVPTL